MNRFLIAAASLAGVLALSACASTGEDAPATAAAAPAPAARPAPAPAAAAAPAAAIAAGQTVFQARCSGCHRPGASAPDKTRLSTMSHDAIVEALTTGKMMAQGRALSDEDKSNVAHFIRSPAT